MIAEAVLLDALEAVHSGRLRVHEAYRTIRAAEEAQQVDGIVLTPVEADLACGWADTEQQHFGLTDDEKALLKRLEEVSS